MKMKKFMNAPETVTDEELVGLGLAYPDILNVDGHLVISKDLAAADRVTIVTYGGSGHEPAQAGFVGNGMLDVQAVGDIFAAPNGQLVFDAMKLADKGHGVLLLTLNYAGDQLAGKQAMKLAKKAGLNVRQVVTGEEIQYDPNGEDNKRGLAGAVALYHVAAAAAREGKTLDEAAALVTQQVQSLISSFKITLRTQDGRSWDITGDSLNMQYNVADQLDQLWAIGHTGSSSVRYEQVKALEEEPAMRYTTLSYDMSQVNQILSQIKSEVDLPAVNATRVDDETKWPPFSYTDETAGQTLDITGLNERICTMVNMLESGVVDLTPVPVQPSVTRAQLEAQIVKLSSFETTVGKTGDYVESRTENIRVGTERFNRLTVAPGKSVSFNKVALKRTAANGYQAALEIAYGNYVEGIGGGICQVSSTLYNAVVNAGLTVNKRTPHAIPSSYVDKGKDATVSDDRYDFVFTNNTGANIYIETQFVKVKGYWTSRFIIYGRPDPNGYTYKLDSQVVETIPLPEPTYKKDNNGEYVIYDDETYQVSKGREGYVVDVYLVTIDSNGLEISREKKYTDTYKAAAPIYYVGVTPRETPIPDTPSID